MRFEPVTPQRKNEYDRAYALLDVQSGKVASESPDVSKILSTLLGQDVELLSSVPEAASLEQYWPPLRRRLTRKL